MNAADTDRWKVRRLSPALGIEVEGCCAGGIDDCDFEELSRLVWESDGFAVLRGQDLTPDQHIVLSRRFGALFGEAESLQESVDRYLLPGHPQIFRASNKVVGDEPQGRERAGNYWHSDVSFRRTPAMLSIAHAIEIPRLGGDTLFCNTAAAFEGLSPDLRRFLSTLQARHDFAINTKIGFSHEQIAPDDLDGQNTAVHPVVRVHPETGRSCLFVNPGNTSHILGLHPEESGWLLKFLYNHCTKPEYVFRHQWKQGDLAIWDNRCTMHYAIVDYTEDRYLHRTTVIGEQPQPVSNP